MTVKRSYDEIHSYFEDPDLLALVEAYLEKLTNVDPDDDTVTGVNLGVRSENGAIIYGPAYGIEIVREPALSRNPEVPDAEDYWDEDDWDEDEEDDWDESSELDEWDEDQFDPEIEEEEEELGAEPAFGEGITDDEDEWDESEEEEVGDYAEAAFESALERSSYYDDRWN